MSKPTIEEQIFDEVAALDEIFERHLASGILEPGEVTSATMAAKREVSVDRARAALEKAFQNKELTRRKVRLGGRPVWAYRPVK